MTIAFYKVNNSLNYGRHEFDQFCDQPQEVLDMLQRLPEDEVKFYDADKYSWQSKTPSLADFENDYNDEELDGGWWCIVIQEPKEQKETLESMVSKHAYEEIVSKVKEQVGEESFSYIFPGIKKALEEGSGKVREEILRNWLDCDSMRVCTQCGEIMQKGWYLECNGYACSDECAAESEGITMEEFEKYRIYKDDILQYLEDEGKGQKIEDLTQDEIEEIIDAVNEDAQYCYTEWY
jgi:hypothetical protein